MFVAFNLKMDQNYNKYYETGKKLFDSNKCQIKKELDSFICGNGVLNGTKMQEDWIMVITLLFDKVAL